MILSLRQRSRRSSPPARRRATLRHARSLLVREKARLVAHFRGVLAELRARDTSHLSPEQHASRARLIAELQRYARTGRFPRNLDFPGIRMPYFVDAFGTRCAMAHLIESTGEIDLVARVAATANNAFVRELEGDITLRAWLDRAGLTAAEAARIQPSYCFVTNASDCFCDSSSFDAVAEAQVLTTAEGVTARVDVLHGNAPASVMVGDTIAVNEIRSAGWGVGSRLLVGMGSDPSLYSGKQLSDDGTVPLTCSTEGKPKITKQDAINAMLAKATDGELSACEASLAKRDEFWGESICDSDGSCALKTGGGAASPLLLGSLVLAAATFARRRRVARKRKASPQAMSNR